MIPSVEAVTAIHRERKDAIVVSTMSPNRYWDAVSADKDLDLPIFGGMGKASSVALGLALAQPDKKVLVLDGDGGLLMNLGTLVTIAGQGPKNMVHFVFDDGVYFTTGAQPVPGEGRFDLAGMAREAGYSLSYRFDDLEEFASELPGILDKDGPVFVCLKVSHEGEPPEVHIGSTRDAMRRLSAKLGRDVE